MKKHHLSGLFTLFGILLGFPALAAEFHVTDVAGFQNALNTAGNNGQDDTIFLAAGYYRGNFIFVPQESNSLVIQGEPETAAGDVILDGDGKGSVMEVGGFSGGITVTFSGLTVQNGSNRGIVVSFQDGKLSMILDEVIIQNNWSDSMGGGLYIRPYGNTQIGIEIRDSIVRNNQAPGNSAGGQGRGGGIYVHLYDGNNTLDLFIVNSLIYGNKANWSGGGINLSASEVGDNNVTRGTIINSTITGNVSNMHGTGSEKGGGVWVKAYSGNGALASLDLYNSIVYGNTSGIGGPGQDLEVFQNNPGLSTVNAFNCDINDVGGTAALYHPTNVISSDPLFVDPANDNYRLTPDSPCIDAGTTSVPLPPGLPTTDFEDNARIAGPFPDIGAYEYVGPQVKPGEGTIGTILDITGAEFGSKRGKVSVGTSALKIIKWTTGWIQASLTKALAPGAYDVKIEPKGTDAIILPGGFASMEPVIDSVEPASGSINEEITIRGRFFGTKKGKVTLGGKNCRVKAWKMNATTGASETLFVVPRGLSAGTYGLKIANGVKSDEVNFDLD